MQFPHLQRLHSVLSLLASPRRSVVAMKFSTKALQLTLYLVCPLVLCASAEVDGPVIQTKLGGLRGRHVSVKGREDGVHAYLGVPFAKPPVGPLRLAPPQPADGWQGVRDATQQPLMCVQDRQMSVDLAKNFSMEMELPDISEDCLYVNIYTPAKPGQNSKLPVMVWIHGGGFVMGSASFYDGSALAAYEDVVVVLIQYRLGILGFFSTGDEHVPGNFGLLDQVEALRWVQEHIHSFGGDPGSVTIFGESSGGVSTSLLLLSPLGVGLFHGAIAESGTAVEALLTNLNPLPGAQMIATMSGCDNSTTEKIAECVMELTVDNIVKIHKENPMLMLGVTVDAQFLLKSPKELLENQEVHNVPFLLGVNSDEMGWLITNAFAPAGWVDGMDREQATPILSMFTSPDPKDQWITELVADEYMGTSGDRVKIRNGFTEAVGDLMFVIPCLKTANLHRDAGVPVYLYEFQETPSMFKEKRPSFVGSDHGDEIIFVFGGCFGESSSILIAQCTEEDKRLSKTMMAYWGNFARTRSPNGAGLVEWPQYGAEGDYLSIGMEQLPGQHLKKERYTFMTETLPEKIQQGLKKMMEETLNAAPVVQTKLGGLRGRHVSVKGREDGVHAYLGVPFAKPPVGPLRLAPPQPADGWQGVRDATQQPLMCVQDRQMSVDLAKNFSMEMELPDISEDCLYVNIYTPAKPGQNSKLPVMVWIHGGGFFIGSASFYDGSALAAYEDVVVVLIQYRLGILGFFSTGDEHVPGNFGLLDQVEALRWVQEHIHSFGGDPGSVTIFGESAGGVSTSLLLLSPLSVGLFHGAIAESGTAAMELLTNLNPLPGAQMIATMSGCDNSSTEKIAECVRVLTVDNILKIHKENPMLMLGVTVDAQFLLKSPKELLENQEVHNVPFLLGFNSDEMGWLITNAFAPAGWVDGMDREQATPILSMFTSPDPKDQWITELVADEYMGTSGDRVKIRNGFTEAVGDLMFVIPCLKTANLHRDAGVPVYLYEFQETPSMLKEMRPSFVGSDHGDEIIFVLGGCFGESSSILIGQCTEEDKRLSKTMMAYWGNFARTRSPNGAGLVEWPQYGAEGDYLSIGMEQLTGQHLKKERYTFMTETLPEKIQQGLKKMMEETLNAAPVVQTKLGGLRGQHVSVKGREDGVHAYLGVPFAKPPVGPLRLAPPQPADGWQGVRDATQQPLMCVQDSQLSIDLAKNFSMEIEFPDISEDCLYVNIYTPAKSGQNSKLPVMVWIHGGGLAMGSASFYDGSVLAAYEDVVVVLIQYRLGILGFFSTGDEHVPGNFGLLDQVEALRWVQEHIHSFGGDPGSVTIFGESAGGVSTSVLLLSPLSVGLFHGAIAESGTAAMEVLTNLNPLPGAQMIATMSGCDNSSTEKIAECVRELTADNILKIHKENPMLMLGVTVDGQFLLKSPKELLENQEVHNVPFLLGVNSDELGWVITNMIAPAGWVDGMDREQAMPILSMFTYPDPKDQWIPELVADEYMGTSGDRVKIRNGFTEAVGDLMFVIPSLKTANFHRDAGVPVYLYEFQETPSMLKEMRPSFVGSDHGDEIIFVFGGCFGEANPKLVAQCTEEDKRLSKTMMAYWGNFAHTRSPNGAGLVEWPQYGAEGDYLSIGMEQLPGQHLKKERYTFMTETLPEKIQQGLKKMMEETLNAAPVVQTKLGGLRGQHVSVKGREDGVHAYLGVPFAKPPVGPLRLAPPQPADGWQGVRDATQQPLMCVQDRQMSVDLAKNFSMIEMELPDISEDCLYVNIYTPAKPGQNSKLPVMVWIHGGGFAIGSASSYDGSALAAYEDVVVVLIQYRLGILGFLSTGDKHVPGNFGFLDQVEALRWVQEHIHSFGGDPGSVTIFGESAGGVSTSLLLLSPLGVGLFHGAIAESGTAAIELLTNLNPLPEAQMIATISGCDNSTTEKIAECVRVLTVDNILKIQKENPMLRLGVTVDTQFLLKSPKELLENQEVHNVPFLLGFNSDEMGWLITNAFAPAGWVDGMDREQATPLLSMFTSPDPKDQWISELVADEYMGTSGDCVKIRNGFTEALGDLTFVFPCLKTANLHRDAGVPVYLYEFQETPSMLKEKRPSFVGSDHGDEIFFVFGGCFGEGSSLFFVIAQCTEEDKRLSRTMMAYWGNFARTRSPNGAGLVEWPQYGAEGDYLSIGMEQLPGQHLKKERYTFMTETLPEKIRLHGEKVEHSEL